VLRVFQIDFHRVFCLFYFLNLNSCLFVPKTFSVEDKKTARRKGGKISKWAAASGPFCCSMLRSKTSQGYMSELLKRIKRRRNAFEILCQVFFFFISFDSAPFCQSRARMNINKRPPT
jgi:hypothetical protein